MALSDEFEASYAKTRQPSILPENLIKALLLQLFYLICSGRLLCEQLEYNLLFRWFLELSMDDAVWNHSMFSKNRHRLMNAKTHRQTQRLYSRRTTNNPTSGGTAITRCWISAFMLGAASSAMKGVPAQNGR